MLRPERHARGGVVPVMMQGGLRQTPCWFICIGIEATRNIMTRIYALLAILVITAGCTAATPDEPLEQLGEFKLGYNVVVTSKMRKGPVSRPATENEWETALKSAVAERFSLYDGEQLYHLGISVEGYMLAPPGIPVLYSPKSALIINVTAWDDAAGKKLNEKVQQFTVFETTTSESFLIGSGYERTKEDQLLGLSRNAVGQIEDWLVEEQKANGWFNRKPGTEATDDSETAEDTDGTANTETTGNVPPEPVEPEEG
jgi:hypothetical protein